MAEGKFQRNNILRPALMTDYFVLLSNTMDCLPPDLRETAEVCLKNK